MTVTEKPACKFQPNYIQRVLSSAKCACGERFAPPQNPNQSKEIYFRDQYDKHRAERYSHSKSATAGE